MGMEIEGIRKLIVDKLSQGDGDHVKATVGDFLREKLAQLLQFLESIPGFLAEKFDQLFPPETRTETFNNWLHIGLTVVLPIVLTLLLLYYCCKCCCCGPRRGIKMMKGPGMKGQRIPRVPFEANPRDYFRGLRASGRG